METKKSERPDFLKLRAAAQDARELAQRLFKNDVTGECWNMRGERYSERNCLECETKRLTGWPKLPQGSSMRAYSMFNPAKLCGPCLSYWYIEMGAQELARLVSYERYIAAAEKRELPRAEELTEGTVQALIVELQKQPSDAKVYANTQTGLCEVGVCVPTSGGEVHILGNLKKRRGA